MTAYTVNYLLPYPSSTDSPCLLAELLATAAGLIEAGMASLETLVSSLVNREEAWRCSSTDVEVVNTGYVPLESVDFDSSGRIDLTADNISIRVITGGAYVLGFHFGALGSSPGAFIYSGFAGQFNGGRDGTTTTGAAQTSMVVVDEFWANTPINATLTSTAAPATITAYVVTMWAMRLGDTS